MILLFISLFELLNRYNYFVTVQNQK